jgi:uncharacterized protein (DUF1778 family)
MLLNSGDIFAHCCDEISSCPYSVRMIGYGIRRVVSMPSATKRREERLEVRLNPRAKSLLKRAAAASHKTMSAFVLDSGLVAAAETLASRTEFAVTARQYEAFITALDAPAKRRPRLEKLLKTASVLE